MTPLELLVLSCDTSLSVNFKQRFKGKKFHGFVFIELVEECFFLWQFVRKFNYIWLFNSHPKRAFKRIYFPIKICTFYLIGRKYTVYCSCYLQ